MAMRKPKEERYASSSSQAGAALLRCLSLKEHARYNYNFRDEFCNLTTQRNLELTLQTPFPKKSLSLNSSLPKQAFDQYKAGKARTININVKAFVSHQ